jgi:hypothetical protein
VCKETGKNFDDLQINISWVTKRPVFTKGSDHFIDVLEKLGDVLSFIRVPLNLKIRVPSNKHHYSSITEYDENDIHFIKALQFYSNQMEQQLKKSREL